MIDSSALISYCKEENDSAMHRIMLERSPCIPMPAYAEVARYFKGNYAPDKWELVRGDLQKFRLLPLTASICERASELGKKYQLAMMDSLICASAVENGLELLTRDADLKGKKGVIYVKQ